MSDHPRTDAVFDKNKMNPHIVCLADLEVCSRKLETELNQARQERDGLRGVCNRIAEHAVNDPQLLLAELLAMDGILRQALEKLKEQQP